MASPGIQVGASWPVLAAMVIAALLCAVWVRRRGRLFPDVRLSEPAGPWDAAADLLPIWLGALVVMLLIVALMNVTVWRSLLVEKRARDFLVLVDTSRSMRENTPLERAESPPRYERRASLSDELVDDPSAIPELARYEVARESLLAFVDSRRPEDRIALIFFNTQIFLMSGFTSNLEFVEQQLAGMDDYVNYTTNIRGALQQGLDILERYPSRNQQAVILLTDAEARHTAELQQQLARLANLDLDFYLLWIAPRENEAASEMARQILERARSVGTVFTVEDVQPGRLDEAFARIGRLESYAYPERRTISIDLSRYAFTAARWLMLLWLVLIATVYYPLRAVAIRAPGMPAVAAAGGE